MKKLYLLLLVLIIYSSVTAQMPSPPPLQPGETWTNLWSTAFDFQSNGSIRYLIQDPSQPNRWCSIIMAQQDSNSTASNQRYIFYSYSSDNGMTWTSGVLNNTQSFGFPCITLKNGIPVIAFHQSATTGSFVYKDSAFGGFSFTNLAGIVNPGDIPIWPHISGTTNGNLVMAATPNDNFLFQGYRTTYNGSSWSPYVQIKSTNGPSGNFDVASGPNGKVVIIGSDYEFKGTLVWDPSQNNGQGFSGPYFLMKDINIGGENVHPSLYGGYQAVYDNAGDIHVITTAYNTIGNGMIGPNTYAYIQPSILHWSSNTKDVTRVAGKYNIPDLADTITQIGIEPLCHPTITKTSGNRLICAFTVYLRGNTQVVQNGDVVNAGEIFSSFSDDSGLTWSVPENITNTPFIEEKHPSLSPNTSSDSLRIFYLRDMKAGNWTSNNAWGKASVYGIFNKRSNNNLPSAPILISPPNSATNISLTPLLDWNNVSGALTYRVQISTDSNFNLIILDSAVLPESELLVPTATLGLNIKYFWRVNAANVPGAGPWSSIWSFRTGTTGVNVTAKQIPTEYYLFNNYPNPFNPSTRIRFDLPKSDFTTLIIFDINGKEISRLVNEKLSAGSYEHEFSIEKFNLSSGIYFYKLNSGDFIKTQRMVLIK